MASSTTVWSANYPPASSRPVLVIADLRAYMALQMKVRSNGNTNYDSTKKVNIILIIRIFKPEQEANHACNPCQISVLILGADSRSSLCSGDFASQHRHCRNGHQMCSIDSTRPNVPPKQALEYIPSNLIVNT